MSDVNDEMESDECEHYCKEANDDGETKCAYCDIPMTWMGPGAHDYVPVER